MKTIKYNITHEYIIQKSKFISMLYQVNNEEEVINILNRLKLEYKDATHICYAYIINNIKRFQEDGEPSGTAGMPILNVIEQQNLNMVLAVVIRYFGGIKLGAGGLVRAYTTSVVEALENQDLGEIVSGYKVTITFQYNNSRLIDNALKNYQIINKEFNSEITYIVNIPKTEYIKIENIIENNVHSIKKEDILLIM